MEAIPGRLGTVSSDGLRCCSLGFYPGTLGTVSLDGLRCCSLGLYPGALGTVSSDRLRHHSLGLYHESAFLQFFFGKEKSSESNSNPTSLCRMFFNDVSSLRKMPPPKLSMSKANIYR